MLIGVSFECVCNYVALGILLRLLLLLLLRRSCLIGGYDISSVLEVVVVVGKQVVLLRVNECLNDSSSLFTFIL